MGDNEFLVDAVAQFLQTQAWQDAINHFFQTRHNKFASDPAEGADEKQSKGVGYSLEQYDVFMQFKELVQRLLEGMMGELGCSGQDLIAVLQESLQKGPTGECRFLIKTLLSFEDYEDFHARITEYGVQQRSGATKEESTGEMTEWEMQVAVAQSLIEANARGLLDDAEQSFLPWAEALVGMSTSTETPDMESKQHCGENEAKLSETAADTPSYQVSEQDERLKALESTLILERLKVDLLVAQRIADANATLKQEMLQLSANQDEQSEEWSVERDLESLFAQLETVRDRIKVVKAKCFEFKNVSPEAMDQMYLFLKEKVHHQQDLVAQEKEIAEFIFSHIEQPDAAIVPLLLEWLLLESEALRAQGQVQEHLGQDAAGGSSTEAAPDEGYWTQSWDESAQAFFYFHSLTGESVWEAPAVGYYDANQDYLIPEQPASEARSGKSDVQASRDTAELQDMINASSAPSVEDVLAMEKVLEKISKEHDEERARLEIVFEVEKARQKEELRRRREKKRRAKLSKKRKEQQENGDAETKETTEASDESGGIDEEKPHKTPRKTPRNRSPPVETPVRAENKDESHTEGLSIRVPGHGMVDLSHLLSESHAKRQLEKRGLTLTQPPAPQAMLNPNSLRFIAESLAKKNPEGWLSASPTNVGSTAPAEFVLEEAEEK